jgi:hypothetical protein
MTMPLPTSAAANARALAKARWLLASYMDAYWTALVAELGASVGVQPSYWSVGADLSAETGWRDVQAAIGVTPVGSTIIGVSTADGTPFQTQDITATWSVVCIVNRDTYGIDTAPLAAQLGCLVATQILVERMADPIVDGDSMVWSCLPVSDAGAPIYTSESAHIVSWRADIEVSLRARLIRIGTLWPGIGLLPYSAQAAVQAAPSLVITGDVSRTVAAGASTSIAASAYTAGLTLTATGIASLVCVNQTTYQTRTEANAGTVTPGELPAAAGQEWTISGVDAITNAIRTYRIVWT